MDKVLDTGKQILEQGWRVIFGTPSVQSQEEKEEKGEDENVLPAFVKGESGPHIPDLNEKWTQPPKPYTEATLLRAMEIVAKGGSFMRKSKVTQALPGAGWAAGGSQSGRPAPSAGCRQGQR